MSLGHRVAPDLFSEPSQRAEPFIAMHLQSAKNDVQSAEVMLSNSLNNSQFIRSNPSESALSDSTKIILKSRKKAEEGTTYIKYGGSEIFTR
ncbi:14383_t:CDS:2 [Funneliformis mosseae]|uniref:14383_t:CDS:1 n=1 Tax=Funneliformis mosseae TaxID=27381 RepID=A0A9N9AC17_FUNMO|nr:14383_t:CDS:2 [Funneliformis mosseae]